MNQRPRARDVRPVEDRIALIVEHDAPVRRLLSTLLARAGYSVVAATTGREAIAAAKSAGAALGVVVLEIELPDMRGTDLAQRLAFEHPRVPVVFLGADAQDEGLRSNPPGPLVTKPFHPDELIGTVEQIVRRASGAA